MSTGEPTDEHILETQRTGEVPPEAPTEATTAPQETAAPLEAAPELGPQQQLLAVDETALWEATDGRKDAPALEDLTESADTEEVAEADEVDESDTEAEAEVNAVEDLTAVADATEDSVLEEITAIEEVTALEELTESPPADSEETSDVLEELTPSVTDEAPLAEEDANLEDTQEDSAEESDDAGEDAEADSDEDGEDRVNQIEQLVSGIPAPTEDAEPAAPPVKKLSDDEPEALARAVEAILFAAEKPVSAARLREVFGEEGPSVEAFEAAFAVVAERHTTSGSGVMLRKSHGGWQFTTQTEQAPYVQKFLAMKPFRLGRSALEVLAITAYRQPVTRAEIDQIRGIDSSHLLRVLMERGLVRMAGKADVPGRPVQYGTTPKFLEVMGLPELTDLPPLSELEQLKGDTPDPIKKLESGLDRFLEETPTHEEVDAQATEGLAEIEQILEKAGAAPTEVFGSSEQQEVARSNEEALLAFQQLVKPRGRRKKTVSYEELVHGTAATEVGADETAVQTSEEVVLAEEAHELPDDMPPPSDDVPPSEESNL